MMNVRAETLEFADGSLFKGQVWDGKGQSSTKPHGYGKMVNKDGFIVEAYWQNGKVNGSGRCVKSLESGGCWPRLRRCSRLWCFCCGLWTCVSQCVFEIECVCVCVRERVCVSASINRLPRSDVLAG